MKKCLFILILSLAGTSVSLWADPGDIHHYVRKDDLEKVRELLEADASVANELDILGLCPLWHAESQEMAQLLLDNGADPNIQSNELLSPLMAVLATNKFDIAVLLLKHQADPFFKKSNGETVLHAAARGGNIKAIKMMLEKGFDIDTPGPYDHTPLAFAIRYGRLEAVQFLLEKGARRVALNKNNEAAEVMAKKYMDGEPHSKAQRDVYLFLTNQPLDSAPKATKPSAEDTPPIHHQNSDGFFSSTRNRLVVIAAIGLSIWLLKKRGLFSKIKQFFQPASGNVSEKQQAALIEQLKALEADYSARTISYDTYKHKQQKLLHGLSQKQKATIYSQLSSF